jgi:hypothetical protein
MERSSDVPLYLGAVLAVLAAGAITYAAVDAAALESTFDSNTPNGTTQGPPASFDQP